MSYLLKLTNYTTASGIVVGSLYGINHSVNKFKDTKINIIADSACMSIRTTGYIIGGGLVGGLCGVLWPVTIPSCVYVAYDYNKCTTCYRMSCICPYDF